jgi:diguanylate cyclase (GGDEF)-like protein
MERQLTYQAKHDGLTGLINRREFESRLGGIIDRLDEGPARHLLCYLDLDQFKLVNDVCGHAAGDALLRQIAALLKRGLRSSDTLARLGGDEFGIILTNCRSIAGSRWPRRCASGCVISASPGAASSSRSAPASVSCRCRAVSATSPTP